MPGFNQLPIAQILEPWMVGMMIPMLALTIPIVALFQSHQQKMAEIIHGRKHKEMVQAELDEMRSEINQLRSSLATQALALEGLAQRRPLSGANETDALSQRLG